MTTDPTALPSASRQRQGLIASYLILNITSGTVGGAMQFIVPLYAISLHAANAQIGLIRGVSGIGVLLLVIPAGFLVDHYGSKRLFLIGGVFGTLGTFCLTFAHTPGAMAAIMGIAGLFGSLKMTALNSSFYNNLQSMGLEKSGWFKGSMSIGLTFVGPLAGGYLIHAISFDSMFKILALLTLVPIGLVFAFHSDPVRQGSPKELKAVITEQLGEFRALVGRKDLYLPLFTETLTTAFFATFSAFIVVIAVQLMHLPSTSASQLMAIEGGVFIATVFVAGPLIKLLTQLQLYVLSITVVIAGLLGLVSAGSFQTLAFVSGVLGAGLGLINLVVASRIGLMKGEKGKIVGLFSAAVGVGASVGPMLGGLIGAWLGARSIFLAFVPLFFVLAWAAYKQDVSDRSETEIEALQSEPEELSTQPFN
jgi:MFS family permease